MLNAVKLPHLFMVTALLTPAAGAAEITPERQTELLHLLRHDCGSCHGMTLKGGLGPSLLPDRLAGHAPEALRATIQHGRPGTPMPPWRGILNDPEIDWLVQTLLRGASDGR